MLKSGMALEEMRHCLEVDLPSVWANDILPLIVQRHPANFSVMLLLCSQIDFLGQLYCGYTERKGKAWPAERYASKVMSEVDPLYETSGCWIFRMYRHGTAHSFEPQLLEKDGHVLNWLLYRGERRRLLQEPGWPNAIDATHLRIVSAWGCEFLPVSLNCLYDDLVNSAGVYARRLSNETCLQHKWLKVAQALVSPKKWCGDEQWW